MKKNKELHPAEKSLVEGLKSGDVKINEKELYKDFREYKQYPLKTCKQFTYPVIVSRITPYYDLGDQLEIRTFVRCKDDQGYFYRHVVHNHMLYTDKDRDKSIQDGFHIFTQAVYTAQQCSLRLESYPVFDTPDDCDMTEKERLTKIMDSYGK